MLSEAAGSSLPPPTRPGRQARAAAGERAGTPTRRHTMHDRNTTATAPHA